VLVPIDSTAEVSNTPASKSIVITVSPSAGPALSASHPAP
jgi:hypothetical protein